MMFIFNILIFFYKIFLKIIVEVLMLILILLLLLANFYELSIILCGGVFILFFETVKVNFSHTNVLNFDFNLFFLCIIFLISNYAI